MARRRGVARWIASSARARRGRVFQFNAARHSTVESNHCPWRIARWRLAVRETFELRTGQSGIAFGQCRSARISADDFAAVREPGATREWRDRFPIGNVFARRDDVFSAYWRSASGGQRNESPLAHPTLAGTAARAQTAAQFARLPVARESGESPARSGRAREGNARLPDENRATPGYRSQTRNSVGCGHSKEVQTAERTGNAARPSFGWGRGVRRFHARGGSGGRIFLSG